MSGTEKDNDRSAVDSNPWANASPRKGGAREDKPRVDGGPEDRGRRVGRGRAPEEGGPPPKGRRPLDRLARGEKGSGDSAGRSSGSEGPWQGTSSSRSGGGSKSSAGKTVAGRTGPVNIREMKTKRSGGVGTGGPDRARNPRPASTSEALSAALIREIEQRLRKHPSGRLVRARRESVPISLEIPIASGKDRLANFTNDLDRALDAAILSLVSEREVAESGSAFCLRCGGGSCEHGTAAPKQVFAGYTANGTPQLEDYGQTMLDLGDPGMSQLFGGSGQVVTRLWSEEELSGQLLPAFRSSDSGFRLLGQVTAGWYWVPSGFYEDEAERMPQGRNFALSFQIALIEVPGQPRRLILKTVGTSPAGGSLEDLHDALGELPWEEARRWCRGALSDVERLLKRIPVKESSLKKGASDSQGEEWHDRVLKILAGFERRLVRRERADQRKTKHAQKRRKQKRPTGHALADLTAAGEEAVLLDTRNNTLVVLGERGRTHIFNESGRLVTSIVYGPEAIAKRRERGVWVAANEAAIAELKKVAGPGLPQ